MKHLLFLTACIGLVACGSGGNTDTPAQAGTPAPPPGKPAEMLISETEWAAMVQDCQRRVGSGHDCDCQVRALQDNLGAEHFMMISEFVAAGEFKARDEYNRELAKFDPEMVSNAAKATAACQ